jgi:hypothetical protein
LTTTLPIAGPHLAGDGVKRRIQKMKKTKIKDESPAVPAKPDESPAVPAKPDESPAVPAKMPERLIEGSRLQLAEGVWYADGIPVPEGQRWIVHEWFDLMQHWEDNKVIEEITERPFPNLDELNDGVPKSQLPADGRKPWSHTHVVKCFDQTSAAIASFASGSIGAMRAYQDLVKSVRIMSQLRGAGVLPIVELKTKPMPTKYRPQPIPRPHYAIVGWTTLNGTAATQLPPPKTRTDNSDPDDGIPF